MSILTDLEVLVLVGRRIAQRKGLNKYYLPAADYRSILAAVASIGDGDVTQKILNYVKPGPPPGLPPSPPTAPVLAVVSVTGSTATFSLTSPSVSPAGISGYALFLGAAAGLETFSDLVTVFPFSKNLPDGSYSAYVKGYDPTATGTPPSPSSAASNTRSFTVTSTPVLGADTKAPGVPATPIKVSGGNSVLETVVKATPTADTDGTPFNQVTTGSKGCKWYKDSVYQTGADSLVPSQTSGVLNQIGSSITTPGTDNGTTMASPVVTANVDAHYSNTDAGFSYWTTTVTGKYTKVTKYTTANGGPSGVPCYYNKPVVDGFRTGLNANSQYVDFILFNSNGAAQMTVEARASAGTGAVQLMTPTAYTLPIYVEKTYDPDLGTVLFRTSPDGSTWTTRYSGGASLGKTYLEGRGAAGNEVTATSSAYQVISETLDPDMRFGFTGTQQVGSTTNVSITCLMYDNASPANESSQSTALTVTYDALPNGGGGGGGTRSYGGGYYIGGSTMNHNTARAIRLYAQEHRTIISYINNWEATFGTTMQSVFASIKAKNSNWEGVPYLDSTRCQTGNFLGAVNNFRFTTPYGSGWMLLNGDGSIAYWGDNFGTDIVENMAATAQDVNGRTVQYFDPLYREDSFHGGGAAGLSSIGASANNLCKSTYWDDFFGGPWIGGLFTPGNVNAAATMQAGYKAMFANWRSILTGKNVSSPESWANISQCLQNMTPSAIAAYAQTLDGGLCENIGSAIGATWTGSSGLISMWQANQLSVVKSGGYPIFQLLCSPTADSAELIRRRTCTAFSQIFGDTLINLQYDPVTYWVAADQLPVRMQFMDVNTTTGVGNPDPYGTDYLILGWMGTFVAGAAGAIQTTPFSGSYMFRREMTQGVHLACAPEASGPQTFTLPYNIKVPLCSDDSFFNGATYAAGAPITMNPGTGFPALKV